MNQKKIQSRDLIKKIVEEEKDNDVECTFKPQLLNTYQKRNPVDQYQYNIEKQKQIQDKIDNMKKQAQIQEMQHCTFRPQVSNNNKLDSVFNSKQVSSSKGFESFMRRQHIAKQEKERKDLIFSNNPSKKSIKTIYNQEPILNKNKPNDKNNKIYVAKCPFNQAVNYLHNALHNLDLD